MCGIAGILRWDSRPVDEDVLAAMRDAMAHRGPDDQGLWVAPDGRCGLGHRRLSIIDLSPQAAQPMAGEDEAVRVVFNGEIYNHAALRAELEGLGHRFSTDHADTEVLVHGFEQWGPGLWPRLTGMFALAVHDGRDGSLTLVRDRVGVKPLYFSLLPGAACFASEIKALLACPDVPRRADPAAFRHALTFMTTPAPLTMFHGVFKLPPGSALRIGHDGSLTWTAWWQPLPGQGPAQPHDPTEREAFLIREIRERLERAVARRMIADVPMGVFLSGGVDSTAMAALMSRLTGTAVRTFTVGFSDHTELNELDHARAAAKLVGADHHEVLISRPDMESYLEQLIWSQDEPIADWVCIPLYFVSRLAADSGVKVIQVGEGADEQFCGYPGYMDYLRLYNRYWRPFRALPGPLRRMGAAVARSIWSADVRQAALADIVDRAARSREHFWGGATVFWEAQKALVLGPGLRSDMAMAEPDPARQALMDCGMLPPSFLEADSFPVIRHYRDLLEAAADKSMPGADVLTRMIHAEFRMRLPELLLMRVDKITMSTSLEARVPYLDHELVELSMDIPMALKIKNGRTKHLLKEAVADLMPPAMLNRPKMGFGAPMAAWLREDFGRRAEAETLDSGPVKNGWLDAGRIRSMYEDHRQGRRDYGVHLWTLYNLCAWHRYWVEGRS